MTVVEADSCSSGCTPSLGGPKKKQKKKDKKKTKQLKQPTDQKDSDLKDLVTYASQHIRLRIIARICAESVIRVGKL